ncbi:alpha/beta fold hydrolase [Variovorax sp. EBFNA2]|uniref:alpha/beta fold hydrolase n=1 Tax=Variovorax sp. EBFNA2 TaxID=3342097 RepID=UPI0029C0697D|nr:alpha/beta fold hydrolase [Variovorax boronicumulans]WPG41426.1 alpha/beta fold hydrolase [Variovorax boronicumulans]
MTQATTETNAASRHLVRYRPPASNADVQIEYADQGAGPVICILPSLARSGSDYDEVARLLQLDGFRVIRPEPRGMKRSEGPMQGLTMHDFAADVAAVLDHEKTGPVVVVGHAWGSQPARMLAADRPDLVCGVVMAAASAGKLPPGSAEQPYSRLRDAIDGAGDMTLPEHQRLDCLQRAFFAPGHDARVWLDGWSVATHKAQSHARIHTPVDDYFSAGTQVPILDLQAEHDAVVIPNVMQLYLGARVTEQVIRDAGHAMAPEQPRAMALAVGAFAHRMYLTQTAA